MDSNHVEYRGVNHHQHLIDRTYGAVHLVRKQGVNHGFLLIEEVIPLPDGRETYQLSRADLFVEAESLHSSDSSGKPFISFVPMAVEDYEESIKAVQLTARSFTLRAHEIQALKVQIALDQARCESGELSYNLAGGGAVYSSFFKQGDYTNCIQWCLDALKAVGETLDREDLKTLSLSGTWTQFIFLSPELVIPHPTQAHSTDEGCQLL